ncbi:hypothetical protein M409DRAFT_53922 [Zasmidium cellare ATCC 36951]|uniref:Uncharacterized protein n=1 Tax=Zasmidium cellare ATCC 36951 TaxID=1080233 RepID=A0A6A6CP08_ZASCE|nr:uncharacterized protein M409DRAFT_53922 [Zasmidium cellare ATCC 36951]KAF2167988.1 hypothetical protein M409DRAFT_53922 [Zasmidium cellare ATCC 36951]
MQLSLLLTTLAATLISAGPIPQPIPLPDAETVALITRSLEARAETAQQNQQLAQAQALAQAHALAQLRQNQQWGRGGGGYPGRFHQAGGGFDLNVLGLLDLSAGGGRTDYCTWPYC